MSFGKVEFVEFEISQYLHDLLFIYLFQLEKFLLEKLDVYESAVGDSNVKCAPRITGFPPAFQAISRNPIVLDLAYNTIEFPPIENRMKKDRKGKGGFMSRIFG